MQFLQELLQNSKSQTSHQKLIRIKNKSYINESSRFKISDKSELVQYATFYYKRLSTLRPFVYQEAVRLWGTENIQYINNILDIKSNIKTVLIGTLFKEMRKKPCILTSMIGVIGNRKNKCYCSDDDQMVLEDSSGRIKIKKSDITNPDQFITGSIIGFLGFADKNGLFEVQGCCYAGISLTQEFNKDFQIQRPLLSSNEERQFIAFISGIDIGKIQEQLSLDLLVRFFRGEVGTQEERQLSKSISRLFICGNSIIQPAETDRVDRGSYRTSDINQKVYSTINELLDQFEQFLDKLSQVIDIDLMPGELDFTSVFMPQQPISPCLFPLINSKNNINLVTNPHCFSMNGIKFLGTSGQNIRDIQMYSKLTDPISILELTLKMKQICPTCPDTLRSYPFVQEDPFILSEYPHIYFAGNQSRYDVKVIEQENKMIKMISIPTFSKTKSLVLVDLQTLQSYEYQIDLGDFKEKRIASELLMSTDEEDNNEFFITF